MNEQEINEVLKSISEKLSSNSKNIIVKKRNGSKVQFDKTKVKDAIKPAFKRSHVRYTNDIYEEILTNIYKKVAEKILPFELSHIIVPDSCRTIKVETIQDIVEDTLMGSFPQVAKEYILYRKHKEQIRDWVDTKEAFITKYKEASNTANATIDDNSNVSNRNIGILNTEIHKEDNIQISRRMVVRKLRKLFPDFDAKQYERDLANHLIYKHDESSFAGAVAPYTYSSKEVVIVRYYDNTFTIPMDMLYDMCEEPEVCVDTINEVYQKYPDNLFIYDYNNEWTQVTHLTKKKRHRDLVRVKTNFGEDLVVTDNHPLITNIENIEDTTQAIDATNKIQYKTNESISFKFNECNTIDLAEVIGGEVFDNYIIYNKGVMKRYLKLDRDFGYFVGFFVGDGNYQNNDNYINFTQKDITVLHKLNKISFDSLGIIGSLYHKNDLYNCNGLTYRYRGLYEIFRNYFHIEDKAQNKTLPINIFDTNEQFALGILEGILDSDGIVYGNQISYKLSSRAAILQISILLRYFGYSVGNTIQDAPFGNNTSYNTNYSLWGVNFTRKNDATPLSNSIKYNKATIQKTASKYKKSGETKINSVVKISDQLSFLAQNKYIYDITTSTHTFSMNNLLVHNCVALTMYPFLDEGIKGIGGLSAKPKNLDSFCGMFVNMIFAISAQFAGAVACPEALLYFDYFARKEWGDDYYLHTDDIVNPRSSHPRTIGEQIRQHFQQIVYSINQPAAARGLQSAFVNFSYYDKAFFDSMFGDFMFPDFTKPQWESLNWLQKDFMQWFNEERLHCILTFPVESFALVYKDGEFLDKENADFIANEYARGHSFFTYISDTVDSLSSCCRLRNAIDTKEFNFTNGNLSLQTGSKSVITLNLSRIIQDVVLSNSKLLERGVKPLAIWWQDYKEAIQESLRDILDRVYKYHIAYNELLWDMKDAKLLPVYDAGFINLDKQYLTIGLNGLNQAAEYLGLTCNDNEEYKSFCQFIFGFVAQMNKGFEGKFNNHKVKANTEQVPAESLAVKNYNWDKEDGYWVPNDTNLYASYVFKPNDDTTNIYEKIRMHGREYIGEYLDGGSAAHINLSEHLTKEQYKNVIKYVAEEGCNYFTFNIPMSECCDCGHIVNSPIEKCPKCGSEHIKYWTRVIGYLTAVPSWSQGRQEEFKTRVFHSKHGNKKFVENSL